jgi:hypothetical protein
VGINLSNYNLFQMTLLSIALIAMQRLKRFILLSEWFLKALVSIRQILHLKKVNRKANRKAINRDAAERRV